MTTTPERDKVAEAGAELVEGFATAATHYRQGKAITSQFALMGVPVALAVIGVWFAFELYGHILRPIIVALIAIGAAAALVRAAHASRKKRREHEAMLKEGRQMPETLPSVLAYCRESDRVCPKPVHWRQLWLLLPNRKQLGMGNWEPAAPLILAAWTSTDADKMDRLREHVEWAALHGALQDIGGFLRTLREDDWHHLGE
ncbi:MAG: hypothetical protein AB7G08_33350 [Hyphomicrobiaceae bacterium]